MMVLPGLEFCKLLVGEEAGRGRKEVFVVGWCVCQGGQRGFLCGRQQVAAWGR